VDSLTIITLPRHSLVPPLELPAFAAPDEIADALARDDPAESVT
jgi:hypothetical protein